MKFLFSYVILVVCLLGLYSCSGKQGSSQLEISTNFVVTGPTNSGGLIAFGKTADGTSSFSAAAINGSSTSVQIKDGKWKIYVVGYASSPFETSYSTPDAKCGMSEVTLGSQDSSINIELTKEKCADAAFVTATDYKKLAINSCGSFYRYDSSTNSFSAPTSTYDCSSLADDLKSSHLAYRLEVLNSDDTGIKPTTLITQCKNNGFALNIPANMLALKVTTYPTLEDCGQNKKALAFHYPNGISAGNNQNFEHFFKSASAAETSGSFLTLPSGFAKKGKSPFMNLLPKILCENNIGCINTPSTPTGLDPNTDIPILVGSYGSDKKILAHNIKSSDFPNNLVEVFYGPDLLDTETCPIGAITSCDLGGEVTLSNLEIKDGNLEAFVETTVPDFILKIKNKQIEIKTTDAGWSVVDHLIELLGLHSIYDEKLIYIFPRLAPQGSEVKRGGIVSDAAFILSPLALGSAVSHFNTCSELYNHLDTIPSKEMTVSQFLQDVHEFTFPATGTFMNVTFKALTTSSRINSFWCSSSSCVTNDPQISISFKSPNSQQSREVITVNCARKVGQLERYENESGEIRRELLLWDTQSVTNSKYELYEYREQTDGVVRAYVTRFEKTSASDFGAKHLEARFTPENLNTSSPPYLQAYFDDTYYKLNTYYQARTGAEGEIIAGSWDTTANNSTANRALTSLTGMTCSGINGHCISFSNPMTTYASAIETNPSIYPSYTIGTTLQAAGNVDLSLNYLQDLHQTTPLIKTIFTIPAN